MSTEQDPTRVALPAAELGALALALGTAASFTRVFLGWDFLVALAMPVTVAWAVAVVTRRLRLHVLVAAGISTLTALVVLAWRFAPGTSLFGIPTPDTLRTLADAVRTSFGGFDRLVAPVQATDGFLVVLAALLWVFVFFADTSAFRYRSPVQAVVPYLAAFVASGVLARDAGRTAAVLAFGAGLGAYAVTQRALTVSGRRWLHGESRRGTAVVAGTAAGLVVVALLVGVVVGPRLVDDTDPVVDLRSLGSGGAARTVVSPFVGVRSLLGERSDQVVFTVVAERPAYWRLTALEDYDAGRAIWVSRGSYKEVEGDLDIPVPDVPVSPLAQRFRIDGLAGLWLPGAYVPARLEGDVAVSVDASSASVITRDRDVPTGTSYSLESSVPAPDAAQLAAATAKGTELDPADRAASTLSPTVLSQARAELRRAGAVTPYQQMRTLQDWFRNEFTYDDTVDYRDAADPVAAFVAERRGFCQQFSSTFALLARSLGLPARVAVGFTPGDPVDLAANPVGTAPPAAGDEPVPGYVVRGRHAHAWPEVWFDGIGWVAFEPTPGRGNPLAEQYTGVPAEQAPAPAPQAATTTSVPPTTSPVDQVPPSTTPQDPGRVDAGDLTTTAPTGRSASVPWWAWAVLVVVLAGVALALRVGRRRGRVRRLRNDPRAGRVAAAWAEAVRWAEVGGVAPSVTETPGEFARRAAAVVGVDGWDELAELETRRRFDPRVPDEADSARAEEVAQRVREQVSDGLPARRKVAALLD
ncbi:MAG: transglutaminase TgpA family protein [Microthrixaceae bacterium]